MSYISITFLAFVSIMFLLYFLLPKRMQWVVLLLSSYVFYIAAGWKFVPFLVLTTVTVFFVGLWLGKTNDSYKADLAARKASLTREEKAALKDRVTRKKRWILASGLILNFGILAFLKYFNFFAGNINALFGRLQMEAAVPQLDLLLPLHLITDAELLDTMFATLQPGTPYTCGLDKLPDGQTLSSLFRT